MNRRSENTIIADSNSLLENGIKFMKKYGFYPYQDKYMYELKKYCMTDT
jgi:hypothetical protein